MSKLGRGLSALIPDQAVPTKPVDPTQTPSARLHEAPTEDAHSVTLTKGKRGVRAPIAANPSREIIYIPMTKVHGSKANPRRFFDDDDLKELAASIQEHGVIQPILVRVKGDGSTGLYEIVAGERRYRAARIAGLPGIPAIVAEIDDRKMLEIAIVENVQRKNLLPMEEAEGYQRLMNEFDYTQDDLALAVGKSRSNISNMVRLVQLPETVKMMMNKEILSSGHGRALLTADEPLGLVEEIVSKKLNVRQTENLVQQANKTAGKKAPNRRDPRLAELEEELCKHVGIDQCRVSSLKGKGRLVLHYASQDQLDYLLTFFNQAV